MKENVQRLVKKIKLMYILPPGKKIEQIKQLQNTNEGYFEYITWLKERRSWQERHSLLFTPLVWL